MNRAGPYETQPLREAVLREIAATGNVKRFAARTVLIQEGDDSDALFILLGGRVKVYVANANGKEAILNEHGPGEYFGELALDGRGRSASVMTLEPTTCAVVTGAHLRKFIVDHPDFAMHLIHGLVGRLRGLTEVAKGLALEDVYGRVAQLLTRMAQPEDGRFVVQERLTQQDIAERVGASREMVSRIFKDLQAGGYVAVNGGHVTLQKPLPPAW
jgi:CRP/FNR family cyclic AMP-dependent transcriptional regulator